jgi:hypothetical protein
VPLDPAEAEGDAALHAARRAHVQDHEADGPDEQQRDEPHGEAETSAVESPHSVEQAGLGPAVHVGKRAGRQQGGRSARQRIRHG